MYVRDPRILDPESFLLRLDLGKQAPVGLDNPVRQAVGTAGDAEVGEACTVLDADEQQRLAFEACRTGVEDGVDGVRPVGRAEDRIARVTPEKLGGSQVRALNIRCVP